jgi:hypothetical protein
MKISFFATFEIVYIHAHNNSLNDSTQGSNLGQVIGYLKALYNFPPHSRRIAGQCLEIGHICILTNTYLQFMTFCLSHLCYINICSLNSALNNLRINKSNMVILHHDNEKELKTA